MKESMIDDILNVGIAFSKEKNRERLLDKILTTALRLTNCDGGTLYLNNGDSLEFHIMITKSQNIHKGGPGQEEITLPPVQMSKQNVCACGVLERKLINIADVYECEGYDFSGPKRYDAMTGYHTQSMMVVPMEDDKENVIGVMQLINALDDEGNVIPFEKEYEKVLRSLGSQAAICLVNMTYSNQIERMLDSFVEVMSVAIDARTPYNVNHTKNMVIYAKRFIYWLNNKSELDWKFSEDRTRVFLLSIWLHDIGKVITPLEIMDKRTRLGNNEPIVDQRLEKIELLYRVYEIEGVITHEEAEEVRERVSQTRELIDKVQKAGYLPDELENEVRLLADYSYIDRDGQQKMWFTDEEMEQLTIKKGTLTAKEREIMQYHVIMTREMLEHMNFEGEYQNIMIWASQHHEFINGKGYPNQLAGDEICKEVRLLTILDVFEALTTKDRPYKASMTQEQALGILHKMQDAGEVDGEILSLFEESRVWE